MTVKHSTELQQALSEQSVSRRADAYARMRMRNEQKRNIKQMFADAQLMLAAAEADELYNLGLVWPCTHDTAMKQLELLIKFRFPSVSGLIHNNWLLSPVLRDASLRVFPSPVITNALVGHCLTRKGREMHDYPYGGIMLLVERKYHNAYKKKTTRGYKKKSSRWTQDSFGTTMCVGTSPGAERILARKRMMLVRYKFICPICDQVVFNTDAWVSTVKKLRAYWKKQGKRSSRLICRGCWDSVKPKHMKEHLATAKDPRIPSGENVACPRCNSPVKKRAYWRVSHTGEAVCRVCRAKEPKELQPPKREVKLPKKVLERHADKAFRERFLRYLQQHGDACACQSQGGIGVVNSKDWVRARKRLEHGRPPCCIKCYTRWQNHYTETGEYITGDFVLPE